jgi:hypothetical protein
MRKLSVGLPLLRAVGSSRRNFSKSDGLLAPATLLATAALALGCNLIAHVDDYKTAPSVASDALVDSTFDGASDDVSTIADVSADSCETGDPLNTCTSAVCVPFDNAARIVGFSADGGLPGLPETGTDGGGSDGGSKDGGDAGSSETGTGLPLCSSLPQPVYVIGPPSLTQLVSQLGMLTSSVPITIVYTAIHSCDGVNAILRDVSATAAGATTANYWDSSGTVHSCEHDSASAFADIGAAGVFPATCLSLPVGTPGVGDFLGPVTSHSVVVPIASTQTSISAEALYYTFGLGTGAVAPWTDYSYIFENPSSGSQAVFGLALGIPPSHFFGKPASSATDNRTKIATSTNPEATLGLMSADIAEDITATTTIKELAYKHFGQSCSYYPSSTATSSDKRNVRDGHYPMWGYTHMLTKVNSASVPLNPLAGKVIRYFTGAEPTPTGDFLRFVSVSHLIPSCAMHVSRSVEMGPITPFTPSPSCSCYFDSLATGSSTCQSCKTSSECPASASHCNLGFCEAS